MIRSTPIIFLGYSVWTALLLLSCFTEQNAMTATAQLNINIGPISFSIGNGDGNGTTIDFSDLDLNEIINDASEFVGQAIENVSLSEELEDLFTLPNFENFSFTFGGNCTFCENEAIDETLSLDGVPCSDWLIISSLGVPETSNQCTLLRAAAVESCGCPAPENYAGRACNVCPEEEEIGTSLGTFQDTIGVTCDDLVGLPAVDGDLTCEVVSGYQTVCECQPIQTSEQQTTTSTSGTTTTTRGLILTPFPLIAGLLGTAVLL